MTRPIELEKRLHSLQQHLQQENPVLLQTIKSFRTLDRVARSLGFFTPEESYAVRVPWWPLIAVLGTYSSGKSSFINYYLGYKLQSTGNQAVDDKYTVICYSSEDAARVLPGLALDADPRFPFYQISRDIEGIAPGEGNRIDAYLQLKTCPSERIRGKILIDSPGFDADAQRTATLRITNHIVDLSDLVLVFFDARHPEPGTMHDTLDHLVSQTIKRADANKFLYILNLLDTTAREDNPEDVIASWQRALAQAGLTAGRFYRIYNPEAAIPIPDDNLRARFESKRDMDMAEIQARMQQVEVDRAYRVVAILEQTAHDISDRIVPKLQTLLTQWRRRVLWTDGIIGGVLFLGILLWTLATGEWNGMLFTHPFWASLLSDPIWSWVTCAVVLLLLGYGHVSVRRIVTKSVINGLRREIRSLHDTAYVDNFISAFRKNTRFWHSVLFHKHPVGWNKTAQRRLAEVLTEANYYVQDLNDTFTNPSGAGMPSPKAATEDASEKVNA